MPVVQLTDVGVVGIYDGPFLNRAGTGTATIDGTGAPSAATCGPFAGADRPKVGKEYTISGSYSDGVKPPIAFTWQSMRCTAAAAGAPTAQFQKP